MKIIDTHQHFWNYQPDRQQWIDETMGTIRRDFLPHHLQTVLEENGVNGCVTVQAEQTVEETGWMLGIAERYHFIRGVVGWVDLRNDELEAQLDSLTQFPLLKGFRHILQSEEPSFMLQPSFMRGITQLTKHNFSYDVLVYPRHLDAVSELVRKHGNQLFVIDHLAKPSIADGDIAHWREQMKKIGQCENVYAKVSGLVTEARWHHWQPGDLLPCLDTAVEAFGTKRLLFGSDWPVCLLASGYAKWLETVKTYFSRFSKTEQEDFFYNNAGQFYRLM